MFTITAYGLANCVVKNTVAHIAQVTTHSLTSPFTALENIEMACESMFTVQLVFLLCVCNVCTIIVVNVLLITTCTYSKKGF